ncbi:CRNN protein, partial [Thinocorus orbignyianus]|nr:CRNN protein [Thinocorus orbignyianus]
MDQPKENTHDIDSASYLCSKKDGNCSPLSREELRQLIEEEFEDVMENPQDPKTVKKVLRFLDDDSNRRVDFRELLSLVFRTAKACYKPLQPGQGQGDDQELAEEKKARGEQPSKPRTAGRDNHQNQEGETPKQDQDDHENQEDETPKQDQDKRETQGETPKQDWDKRQTQEGERTKWDQGKRETQQGKAPNQDPDNRQTQEDKTKEWDEDDHQDDGTGTPERDPKRGDTATPGQDRNSHKAEKTKTPKQDPKPHQKKETEAPGQGSNYHQSPETESAEKDLTCPSETRGRDPKNKTQVCEAPNPDKTQKLLPPQRGTSPRGDPKPQGTHHDQAFQWLPEPKVPEQQHSRAEAPSHPTKQHQDTHQHKQPVMDQQVLQSLYQWPPQP